jgi:chemotaxis protein methyltransferase CheR
MFNYNLSDNVFNKFADFVYKKSGICLPLTKKPLLHSRLTKMLRKRNIPTFSDYYEILKQDKADHELTLLINLISTNVTYFFREEKHFEFISNHFNGSFSDTTLDVWCCAASTGEEPYSLAIQLEESGFEYKLLGTDISTEVLHKASRGIYTLEKLDNIDIGLKRKYFKKGKGKAEGYAKVSTELRKKITFAHLNLIEEFKQTPSFDLISCRNVMIYFDVETKTRLIEKLTNCLKPGGFLFVGHSESLNNINHTLKYIQPAVYRKL